MIGLIIAASFYFYFIALAVNVIDRHGPSSKKHRHLQPNKTKVKLY